MSFSRAIVIAIMVVLLDRTYPDPVGGIMVALAGYFLWSFTPDPLPAAIRKGLEDFAKAYRR